MVCWWANQTDATLSYPSATVAQSGSYSVVVTGACGMITSSAFRLTVVNYPVVSISPASATICPGTSTNLTASGGTTYFWTGGLTTPTISANAAGTLLGNGHYSRLFVGYHGQRLGQLRSRSNDYPRQCDPLSGGQHDPDGIGWEHLCLE